MCNFEYRYIKSNVWPFETYIDIYDESFNWGLGPRLGGFLGETMVVSTVLVQPLNHVKKLAIKTEEPLKIVLIFALKVKTQIMCK